MKSDCSFQKYYLKKNHTKKQQQKNKNIYNQKKAATIVKLKTMNFKSSAAYWALQRGKIEFISCWKSYLKYDSEIKTSTVIHLRTSMLYKFVELLTARIKVFTLYGLFCVHVLTYVLTANKQLINDLKNDFKIKMGKQLSTL